MIGVRILISFVGGYAVASAAASLLASLPGDRGSNVLGATLAAFAIWVGAAIWLFAIRSAKHACLGAIGATALMMALALLVRSP